MAFLGKSFIFLTSTTSWGLHCSLGFTLKASHNTLSWANCIDLYPVTPCLQACFWSMSGSTHGSIILAFCMPVKPESHWLCQCLLPVETVVGLHSYCFSGICFRGSWARLNEFCVCNFLGDTVCEVCPRKVFSLENVFRKSLLIHILQPVVIHTGPTPDMPSMHLFYCPWANYILSFHGTNFFRIMPFLSSMLPWVFWPNCNFSLSALFLLPILTENLSKNSQQYPFGNLNSLWPRNLFIPSL